jgi:tetratricopeptide (TPR) repeat protein
VEITKQSPLWRTPGRDVDMEMGVVRAVDRTAPSRWVRAAFMASALLLAGPAAAQSGPSTVAGGPDTVQQVERLSQEGVDAFREGRYREALMLFKAALALQPVGNLLFNIARTHEKLGETEEAIAYYERFAKSPDAPPDAVDKAKERLLALRSKDKPKPVEPAPAPAPAPVVVQPEPVPTPAAPVGVTEIYERPDDGISDTAVAGWSIAGVGAAALILGGVFEGLAVAEEDSFSKASTLGAKATHRDRAENYAVIGDVGIGVGIAGVVTGAILLIVDATDGGGVADAGLDVGPTVMAGGGGVSASLRF